MDVLANKGRSIILELRPKLCKYEHHYQLLLSHSITQNSHNMTQDE